MSLSGFGNFTVLGGERVTSQAQGTCVQMVWAFCSERGGPGMKAQYLRPQGTCFIVPRQGTMRNLLMPHISPGPTFGGSFHPQVQDRLWTPPHEV
jgi:hypothetical protein